MTLADIPPEATTNGGVWIATALAVLLGRVVAPGAARTYLGRGPVMRAGLDALVGAVVVLTVTFIGLFDVQPRLLYLLPPVVGVLAIAWGARIGTRPSGGEDDLTGGTARILGAAVGLLAASALVLAPPGI